MRKDTLLLVIVYRVPNHLNTLIDDFVLLVNELPTQHRILIVGDFSFAQMLPENVAKVDSSFQKFKLSQGLQDSTQIRILYRILYLILQNLMLFCLSHHTIMITLFFFFFSKSDHYIYIEFSFQQISF